MCRNDTQETFCEAMSIARFLSLRRRELLVSSEMTTSSSSNNSSSQRAMSAAVEALLADYKIPKKKQEERGSKDKRDVSSEERWNTKVYKRIRVEEDSSNSSGSGDESNSKDNVQEEVKCGKSFGIPR